MSDFVTRGTCVRRQTGELPLLLLLARAPMLGVLGGLPVLRAAGDGDLCVLMDHGAVLPDERGRHRELRSAEVPVGGECGVAALGELEVEAREWDVGDR